MKTTYIDVPGAILGNDIVHLVFVYFLSFEGTYFQR